MYGIWLHHRISPSCDILFFFFFFLIRFFGKVWSSDSAFDGCVSWVTFMFSRQARYDNGAARHPLHAKYFQWYKYCTGCNRDLMYDR
ncbi:hypothetical protein HOY80DRAFT_424702 [Tuber brumale]|nr:hypothetical protein HOY80DRAFT_424702 [Tuber brumale]